MFSLHNSSNTWSNIRICRTLSFSKLKILYGKTDNYYLKKNIYIYFVVGRYKNLFSNMFE